MSKLKITFLLLMVVGIQAQDEVEYKYEPEDNSAEYYIGTYNKGKDFSDMVDWYSKFDSWTKTQASTYDEMSVGLLTPYFHSDMNSVDVIWVNNWSTPTKQFEGLDAWMKGGGKLLETLPATNSQQINAYQWVISENSASKVGDMFTATYSDCMLDEGYNLRQVYDLYMDFAKYAQSQGDTIGRKFIVPSSGYTGDADFVRLLSSSPISAAGVNQEIYWDKINGSEADVNLTGFSCSDPRTYMGVIMRMPK